MESSLSSSVSSMSTFKLLVTALIVICLLKALAVIYHQFTYWKKRGIPHIGGLPLFGTSWRILLRYMSFPEYCMLLYNYRPKARYVGIMDMATPGLVVRDPELIKEITVKNFEHFPDHRSFVDEDIDPIFGKNVFSLRGERWREMRNTLSPSFTASKMRYMFELVSKCSHEFVGYLAEHPDYSSSIEAKDLFTRYTNDVIATVAFGIGINSLKDPNNEFFVRGGDASSFGSFARLLKFMVFRLSPKLAKMLGFSFLSKETTNFFKRVVSDTVTRREKEGIVRPDMIHLLMQARDKAATHEMTIDDIVAQAFIFFLAGFDTSSTLMCHIVHELAVHQDIQQKLRDEVEQYLAEGNGEITYEAMAKMEYMEMVISETLRKYPPVIFIDRLCVKSFELPPPEPGNKNFVVEPDTVVWFPVYALHRDPKYFPNPEKFDPERFSEENKDNVVPYSYMPFGLGPRKCIGNRFALMETKIVLAHLLRAFVLKPTEKTKEPIEFSRTSFTLRSKGGLWIGLEKRIV